MARIVGVDIPREKRIEASLTYIYGIGPALAKIVLDEAGVDPNKRTKNLTEKEISELQAAVQSKKVEGDLRREEQQNIKRKMDIKCYAGMRHSKGLPVRGQRTHTNARTRKGPRKIVGVKINKKAPAPK